MASYDFYISSFGGKLTAEAFEAVKLKATAFVSYMLLGRMTGSKAEDMAICAVADVYANASAELERGAVISSENNDGYSVSYANGMTTGESVEEATNRRAAAVARIYLRQSRHVEVI